MTLEERVEACEDGSIGDVNVEVRVDIEVEVAVSSFVSVNAEVELEVMVEITPPVVVEVKASTIVDVEVKSSAFVLKEVKVIVPPGRRLIPPGPSQSSPSKQHFGCPFVPNPAQYVPGWQPTSSAGQQV